MWGTTGKRPWGRLIEAMAGWIKAKLGIIKRQNRVYKAVVAVGAKKLS